MTGKKKMSYDEARKRLAELQAVMKDEELSVEEAVRLCEEAEECYKVCKRILEETKQKIEVFREEER